MALAPPARESAFVLGSPEGVLPLGDTLLIGRDPEADLVLSDARVSRRHALLTRDGDGYRFEDLGSANGTFVDGRRVDPGRPARLRGGERLRFAEVEVTFGHRAPVKRPARSVDATAGPGDPTAGASDAAGELRLDVCGLEYDLPIRGRRVALLQDIRFTAYPREVVAVIGPSGAGKTTLINVLNGTRAPSQGRVLYNGEMLHDRLEELRSSIGYVPQDDIIHRELKVDSVLRYAARLRLPHDLQAPEIETLIGDVLKELDLSHRRDAVVSTLSGGERKRVNIAVELLTRPSLLLLDEPTSGLDPGLERRVVAVIRRLAREGRTVLFVTHATESIAQCDMVLFLTRGGRMAFFGPPAAALEFFGVSEFADAYLKVAEEETDWPERFRGSEQFEAYIEERGREVPPPAHRPSRRLPSRPGRRGPSALQQLAILFQRYAEVLRGDPRNLLILLLQAPFIATILTFIYSADTFTTRPATTPGESPPVGSAPELLFLVVIAALWFGTTNAAREISKERAIFLRERLVNLRIWPYLLSKAGLLSLFCLLQSMLLLGIVGARIDFHLSAAGLTALVAALFLTSLAATLQGLLISALTRSNDQAMSLVPLVLLPQVIFSGMLVGLDDLGPFRAVANLMPGRWGYGALTALTELPDRFVQAGIGRHVKAVFDTSPEGAMIALAVIGGVSLVAAWGALLMKEWR